MQHTPLSLRSSVSPYQQHPRRMTVKYNPSYPTPPQTGFASMQATPNLGLGLYACSMAPSTTPSAATTLPPSPQPSELWTHPVMPTHDLPNTSQAADIFSEAYDPFSTMNSASTSACMPPTYAAAPHDAPGLTQSPGRSSHNQQSHRSSISSSYAPSDVYSQPGSDVGFTPKVKMEDSGDWFVNSNNTDTFLARTLSPQGLSTVAPDPIDPFSRPYYVFEPDSLWVRSEKRPDPSKGASGRPPHHSPSSPEDDSPKGELDESAITTVPRLKKKRQRTTPEDATHECRICGHLFKRSYNWKSHMDIHNPGRKYPHPCQEPNCTKKFTRRTDLDRHHESVHLKKRNFRCGLCGHKFARKDTLRRHCEDGCPKRSEFASRAPRPSPSTTHSNTPTNNTPARNRSFSVETTQPPTASSAVGSTYSLDAYTTPSDFAGNSTGYFY